MHVTTRIIPQDRPPRPIRTEKHPVTAHCNWEFRDVGFECLDAEHRLYFPYLPGNSDDDLDQECFAVAMGLPSRKIGKRHYIRASPGEIIIAMHAANLDPDTLPDDIVRIALGL